MLSDFKSVNSSKNERRTDILINALSSSVSPSKGIPDTITCDDTVLFLGGVLSTCSSTYESPC